jgi:hypothetical protein
MLAIDSSVTPYYSMAIRLAKSPLFSIAIHPMSVVHCKKVTRLRQVCHHGHHLLGSGLRNGWSENSKRDEFTVVGL